MHIIAAMAIVNTFDMSIAKRNIPTTKLSGGQRGIPGEQFVDAPDSRTFTVPYLERKLLQQPHYPHGWKIWKEFEVEVNGVVEYMEIVGKIRGYSRSGGRYKWLVAFNNRTKRFLECQELVQ